MDPCTMSVALVGAVVGPLALKRLSGREVARPEPAPPPRQPPPPDPGGPDPAVSDKPTPILVVEPGTELHGYRVLDELGHGGTAVVWRVERLEDGAVLALKMLHPHLWRDGRWTERFLTEARALLGLEHPDLVKVVEVIEEPGLVAIVMELLVGQTLQQRIAAGPVTPAEAITWIAAALEGLDAVHQVGIVHRDIKPANLFLASSGRVVLMDFGIAQLPGSTLTRTESFMGTPAYSSPEQIRSPREVDARADLFSMGAVLFELLAGRPPFTAVSDFELKAAILAGRRAELPSQVPASLQAIVARALDSAPDARFQDADEMARALRSLHAPSGPATGG